MDKATLSTQDLEQLVHYIHSRGFKEPLVVMDILDHFSCKVEELMAAQPKRSLAGAMQEAHYSFGVKGFMPLAEASKGVMMKRCSATYTQERTKLLTTPTTVMVIAATTILFYYGYYWAAIHNYGIRALDYNLFTFIGYILALGSVIYANIRFKKYTGLLGMVSQSMLKSGMILWCGAASWIILMLFDTRGTLPVPVLALSRTVVFTYVLVRQWTIVRATAAVIRSFRIDLFTAGV